MFTNDVWQEKTKEFLVYGEIVRSEIIAKLTIGNIEIVNCWPYLVVHEHWPQDVSISSRVGHLVITLTCDFISHLIYESAQTINYVTLTDEPVFPKQ